MDLFLLIKDSMHEEDTSPLFLMLSAIELIYKKSAGLVILLKQTP